MVQNELVGPTFVELADTLVEGYDLIDFLHLLAERCVQLLGIAEAGVLLADRQGELQTLASSSERMRLLELIELQRHEGPCQDSYREGGAVAEHDIRAAGERWPRFGAAALAAGFRSVYAVPLRLRAERLGILNLFSEQVTGLSHDDQVLAQAMADVATIGILHARVVQQREILAEQLQVALDSRVSLEQAKGLVAEQAAVDMDQAFNLLRGHARHNNHRLGDVVAAVINRNLTASELRRPP